MRTAGRTRRLRSISESSACVCVCVYRCDLRRKDRHRGRAEYGVIHWVLGHGYVITSLVEYAVFEENKTKRPLIGGYPPKRPPLGGSP
jgi:hypothetical protein